MSTVRAYSTRLGTRWRVMWREGSKQHSKTFLTQKQAQDWAALLAVVGSDRAVSLLRDGDSASMVTSRSVTEQVAAHIDTLTGVTEGTRRVYRRQLERVIAPTILGRTPLAVVSRDDLAAWVNDLDAAGVAAKTLANYHGLVSAALSSAVRDGYISANPSHGMRLPRGDHAVREMVFLTPAEFQRLHDAMTPHYRPLLLLLVGTGLRFGEATALRVGDVTPANSSARVTRAWKYTGTAAREIGSPKTSRSTRTVALPSQTLAALDLDRPRADYLLVAPKGGVVRQPVFFTPWRKAVAGAELDVVPRVHDLRHTFASWAMQAGIPLPVIQRQLGHESITTTVDRYGHLARSDFDALAAATTTKLAGISQSPIANADGTI